LYVRVRRIPDQVKGKSLHERTGKKNYISTPAMAHETKRAYMSRGLVRRGLIGIREFSRPLCGRSIIFIWRHVANMHRIYSSDRRTANRGTGSARWGLCGRWFIGFRGGVERRLEWFCIPHFNILVLMNRVLRLRLFFCHRYVSRGMSGRWRRRTERGGDRVLERRNDDEKDERMKEKKDGLGTIGASTWGRMDASSSLSRLIW
jgi:hypothetical protein